jgi:hypothetical protein
MPYRSQGKSQRHYALLSDRDVSMVRLSVNGGCRYLSSLGLTLIENHGSYITMHGRILDMSRLGLLMEIMLQEIPTEAWGTSYFVCYAPNS